MRFDVITLFPELFGPHQRVGITRRAYDSGALELKLWPLREHADDAYRRVDDRPFGGGPGMVMLAEPLQRALAAVRRERGGAPVPLVHFSPSGEPLTQAHVERFASGPGAVLLCARYEGVDQRFIDAEVDLELSLGDYVLSGGELPALVLLDAVARLLPGVLSEASHQHESFSDDLLEGPHYSRPEVLATAAGAQAVPPVLLSGHHAEIARWRREQALRVTAARRPELIARARARGRLSAQDEAFLRSLQL
ncbi:MAG: tRNA (guanosine(37)-N1)-methyltransferase TrmD [Ideonella sp.]|nr:tRNA (guanosine(37)-N1)-methyltransferase TrmD [Ideonella sp.]MCC7456593.1 tRNA (guanosine(37)-N1)-methyltransferase TrmD [Nitrospira sp.]